jgi:hypothetical protein
MRRRHLHVAAALGAMVFGVAVFLPWVGSGDGAVQVAGWGSGYAPRLRGMLVIACAGVAVSCLAAAMFTATGRSGWRALAGAELAAIVALVASLSVVVGTAGFIGVAGDAHLAPGLVVALFGEVLLLIPVAAALLQRVEAGGDEPAWDDRGRMSG